MRPAACPTFRARSGVMTPFARPRMPSVPKYFRIGFASPFLCATLRFAFVKATSSLRVKTSAGFSSSQEISEYYKAPGLYLQGKVEALGKQKRTLAGKRAFWIIPMAGF
jgi:hypothetical protein